MLDLQLVSLHSLSIQALWSSKASFCVVNMAPAENNEELLSANPFDHSRARFYEDSFCSNLGYKKFMLLDVCIGEMDNILLEFGKR